MGLSFAAPLAGRDELYGHAAEGLLNFNPRTPCGVRRADRHSLASRRRISIHAPLAGCDPAFAAARAQQRHFNPRTPCGVRPQYCDTRCLVTPFQSTHPLRGATLTAIVRNACGCISIHAPLAGCDRRWQQEVRRVCRCQSTHPLRGATSIPIP